MERADSVAVDPHEWLHAPFEVGCVLVRDAAAHLATFSVPQEYLEKTPRGLASAAWLYDYGLQTTRGFRALKVWMALKEHGVEKFGRLIDQSIAQGCYLDGLIASEPLLERVARMTINIVCFRYCPLSHDEPALKRLNVEIMLRLQEDGVAAISDTTVHGKHCLRVAINNHRMRRSDLDLLVREILRLGREIGMRDWGWRIATGRICFGLVGIWPGSLPMVAMYPVLGSFCRRLLRGSQNIGRGLDFQDVSQLLFTLSSERAKAS